MKREQPVVRIIVLRTAQFSAVAWMLHWLLGWPLTGPNALGLFLTPVLCLYFVFVFVAPWSWGLPVLTRLKTGEKIVALTFDDGPSEITGQVLDSLREFQATATFLVLGEAAERFPELICRIISEGHTLGIHAWRHQAFVGMGSQRIADQIERTEAAIQRACPHAPAIQWVRPPHGLKSVRTFWIVRKWRLRLVAWNVDSRDYQDGCPDSISRRVLKHLKPGAIVLLHDGEENIATVDALPQILMGLKARGFRCVALGEQT